MKLILIHSGDGRLVMAEHAESGLLIFRHSNEAEIAFLDRARDQVAKLCAGRVAGRS